MKKWLSSRRLFIFCGALVVCVAMYVVWDFVVQKNFSVVVDNRLYRSGQPRPGQLERWIALYGLKTIVVLRPTLEPYEKEIAERTGVALHHIVLSSRKGPSDDQWHDILTLFEDERNWPILYHCRDGADKTGIVTAMYRIEVQGWPLWKALLEMNLHYHIPFSRPQLQRFLKERYGQSQ